MLVWLHRVRRDLRPYLSTLFSCYIASNLKVTSCSKMDAGLQSSLCPCFKTEDGEKTKENGWLLEAGKEKEMDSPLQPPERNEALLTTWF